MILSDSKVSLCITVYNEARRIEKLLRSIDNQESIPDETIIVDGGSTDETWEILQKSKLYGLKRFCVPEYNIKHHKSPVAAGRNFAIDMAEGEIIVVTDGGCILDPMFIKYMTDPFYMSYWDTCPDVIGGWTEQMSSTFAQKIANILWSIDESKMISVLNASSRAIAFQKSVWKDVGGYPEISLTAEDTAFNKLLHERGYKYMFVPDATVQWWPPETIRGLLRQTYRYAVGDSLSKTNRMLYFKKFAKLL